MTEPKSPHRPPMDAESPREICIVGGGPGGLFLASLLAGNRAYDVTLLEATGRLGGKIETGCFEGLTYERGTAELYDFEADALRPYLEEELSLSTFDMNGKRTLVGGALLGSAKAIEAHYGSESFDQLLRFLDRIREARPKHQFSESPSPADNQHPLSDRSFQELLDEIEDPRIRHLVKISTNCDLAADPSQASGLFGVDNLFIDGPLLEGQYCQIFAVEGGIERIIDALVDRVDAEILLKSRVRSIERVGERYRVHFGGSTRDFDVIALAMPINRLARIQLGGDLAEAKSRHIADYGNLGQYLRCTLFYETPFWRSKLDGHFFQIDDFGGATVYDESLRFDHGGKGVISVLTAGSDALELDRETNEEVVRTIQASLARIAEPSPLLGSAVVRWIEAVNAAPGGSPVKEERERHFLDPKHNPNLLLVGDYLFDSTVNGALASAQVVAGILDSREWTRNT